jgi:hypothetical protein
VNSAIDRYFKPRGRCGVCGGPDARHRIIDAIAEQLAAGMYPEDIATELAVPLKGVYAVLAATVKLTTPAIPGLGVRRILAYGKQVGVAVNCHNEDRPWDGVWLASLWPVAGESAAEEEQITRDRLKDLRAALLERLEQRGMWWAWE